jgi:hypothetical protein
MRYITCKSVKLVPLLITIALLLVVAVLGQPAQAASYQLDMKEYPGYYLGSNGFIIKLEELDSNSIKKSSYDEQGNLVLTTNVIEQLTFEVYWHDDIQDQEKVEDDIDDDNLDQLDADDIMVTYKQNNTTYKAETRNSKKTFVIKDYHTGLSRSGNGKIQIEISEVDKDNPVKETISIPFKYHLVDMVGSKQKMDFKAGSKLEAFNKSVVLEFPKDSYLIGGSSGSSLPEQTILFQVNEQPGSTKTITFVGNSYTISAGTSNAKPSASGTITFTYDDKISKEAALYNLSVFIQKDGNWIPIGGIVDSSKHTISAPFHEFGTYAVALHYTTYSGLEKWAEPYIIPLTNKGIISQELLKKKLQSHTINRFEFTVMLVKALGWKPVPYDGYFVDLSKNHSLYQDEVDYVMAAISKGLLTGRTDHLGNNYMDPSGVLTREHAAVFVSRAMNLNINTYADLKKTEADLSKLYVDYRLIGKWAWPNVLAINKEAIMMGDQLGRFNPKQPLTFAQASTIIYRMMDKMGLFGK